MHEIPDDPIYRDYAFLQPLYQIGLELPDLTHRKDDAQHKLLVDCIELSQYFRQYAHDLVRGRLDSNEIALLRERVERCNTSHRGRTESGKVLRVKDAIVSARIWVLPQSKERAVRYLRYQCMSIDPGFEGVSTKEYEKALLAGKGNTAFRWPAIDLLIAAGVVEEDRAVTVRQTADMQLKRWNREDRQRQAT